MSKQLILVPDIGDYQEVPVIEVLVKAGDVVEKEQIKQPWRFLLNCPEQF